MSDKILGGEVTAQYSASTPEGLPVARDICHRQQEELCGYALVPVHERQTHYVIGDGANAQDVYEVFVTFGPKPSPSPESGGNGTSV